MGAPEPPERSMGGGDGKIQEAFGKKAEKGPPAFGKKAGKGKKSGKNPFAKKVSKR